MYHKNVCLAFRNFSCAVSKAYTFEQFMHVHVPLHLKPSLSHLQRLSLQPPLHPQWYFNSEQAFAAMSSVIQTGL